MKITQPHGVNFFDKGVTPENLQKSQLRVTPTPGIAASLGQCSRRMQWWRENLLLNSKETPLLLARTQLTKGNILIEISTQSGCYNRRQTTKRSKRPPSSPNNPSCPLDCPPTVESGRGRMRLSAALNGSSPRSQGAPTWSMARTLSKSSYLALREGRPFRVLTSSPLRSRWSWSLWKM